MNMPPDHGYEPADFSELTATDALLDRLGARNASEEDRRDPTAAVLIELLAMIDQPGEPDVDAVRLIEVLAGRPLYITGADPTAHEVPLMIDLTGPEVDQDEVSQDPSIAYDEPAASVAASAPEPLVPAARSSSAGVIPIRITPAEVVRPQRWERVLSHASLPAASVLFLIAVGGGVSAAVTGNPMAPVDSISRVMAQLPGVDDSMDRVKSELAAARRALADQDAPAAAMHLQKAKNHLADVPSSDKPELNEAIAEVEVLVVPTTSAAVPAVTEPANTAPPATAPQIIPSTQESPSPKPSASTPPSPTASPSPKPEPTPEPEPEPEPTQAPPKTPQADPTTAPPVVEPTPAVSPSSG